MVNFGSAITCPAERFLLPCEHHSYLTLYCYWELIIIEGSTPGDMNLEEKTENKKTKCSHLGIELLRQNELKSLKLISLIIGPTGVILDSTVNSFKLLFRNESTSILRLSQKAVIMADSCYIKINI